MYICAVAFHEDWGHKVKKVWHWLGAAWIVVLLMNLMGLRLGGFVQTTTSALVVISVVLLLIKFAQSSAANAAVERARADAFAKDARYVHRHEGTAIAICMDESLVRLKYGTTEKSYAFSDIREWERKWLTGGHVVGYAGSVAAGAAQAGANARINRENKQGSGLFIRVRDIDHPQWRIAFPNQNELMRWHEILQQTVSESRSP